MTPSGATALTQHVRLHFVRGLCNAIAPLDQVLLDFFTALMSQTGTTREMQERRDAWMLYQKEHQTWADALARAWQEAMQAPGPESARPSARAAPLQELSLELLSEDVMDNKIVASRMAMAILEIVNIPFDMVRRRTQHLEGQELASHDILRPETCCLRVVQTWVECKLHRHNLQTALEPLQRTLAAALLAQYQAINRLYDDQGVTQQVDLRVRRAAIPAGAAMLPGGSANAPLAAAGAPVQDGNLGPASGYVPMPSPMQQMQQMQQMQPPAMSGMVPLPSGYMPASAWSAGGAAAPLVRARQRAQQVMGQLQRLLAQPPTASASASASGYAGGYGYDAGGAAGAMPMLISPALQQALGAYREVSPVQPPMQDMGDMGDMADINGMSAMSGMVVPYNPALFFQPHASPQQLVGQAREQSNDLKKKAANPNEKAIIEIVALMFQSILTEERVPPTVRVWFARLQVPVLRVALEDPDFFTDPDYPARRLIDRMGACVMGFDSASIDGSALENEVRRIVQVIEQYPETGKRVFELVYEEFDKFLSQFLAQERAPARLVSVAQQVEQRETLAIQYTIELRNLLKDVPVRDQIRDFLFKVWTEVLAMAAVRDGPQHTDTLALKHTAADLVWAASAKPNRNDRAQVIQTLPGLLQRLRQGFALLGMEAQEQEAQLKILTDTLAEAFLAKTAPIPPAQIEAIAKRLAHLEDFIDESDVGDMPLSNDNIEMLLGIDASALQVIADTGAPVEPSMLAWAQGLTLGAWYHLDHNGASTQVQYAWRSQRKQLHLFAVMDGSCYLIQLRRLAAYLQAGLLVPQDEEGLTVRATREALAKIDANPERLLN